MSDNSDFDYDDGAESGDDEMTLSMQTICLLCPLVFEAAEKAVDHMLTEHFNCLRELFTHPDMDFFLYMKLVNYIREKGLKECDLNLSVIEAVEKEGERYLRPHVPNDGLLLIDFEGLEASLRALDVGSDETITIQRSEYITLLETQRNNKMLRHQLDDLTYRFHQDIEKIRRSTQNILLKDKVTTSDVSSDLSRVDSPGSESARLAVNGVGDGRVAALTKDEDEGYSSSYSHYSIHLTMLQDEVRTLGYREAIEQNPDVFRDKVVLDVGCGTGILSMFAARAGAKHVYAVDMSEIAYEAMGIVIENGLSEKITIIKEKIEKLQLPVSHVDIIISEWMGYFLLFESMLDSVIYARQKWLAPSGFVLPNQCVMKLSVSDDISLYKSHLAFWDDVYGTRMSCMKRHVMEEALVMEVNPAHIMTLSCDIKVVDCQSNGLEDLNFTSEFSFSITSDTKLTALIGWFDADFSSPPLNHKCSFSTSPHAKQTHWKQTVFLLPKPYPVIKGSKLEGKIKVEKHRNDPRALSVTFNVDSQTLKYTLG